MELNMSSAKPDHVLFDGVSDSEEKGVGDDDDNDRNHKHRSRETQSQSLEKESMDEVLTRPYRKRNRPLENGHPYWEGDSQPSGNWKNYALLEKDLSAKFEKRIPDIASLSRAPLDINQIIRSNHSFPSGSSQGRCRESNSWSQRDSRFSSVDIASQVIQQGSVPSSLFAGRVPNVANGQCASWSAFGLLPGIPNGSLDPLHSLGWQGTVRQPVNSSLNVVIRRQRCTDFEERGFCLRGDMCPMEHGINRIVIEYVQSFTV